MRSLRPIAGANAKCHSVATPLEQVRRLSPRRSLPAAPAAQRRAVADDRPPYVVAGGTEAQDVCARAGVEAIGVRHPRDRGLGGGGMDRERARVVGLREAARRDGLFDEWLLRQRRSGRLTR